MNDINKIDGYKLQYENFINDLNQSLKYNGLLKLLPFISTPNEIINENEIQLRYSALDFLQQSTTLDVPIVILPTVWTLYVQEKIAIKIEFPLPKAAKYYDLYDARIPAYVSSVFISADKTWNRSFIRVTEHFPYFYYINISPQFNLKKRKKEVLKEFANNTVLYYDREVQQKIDNIINKKISFKQALDEIYKLSGEKPEVNYSFCLNCERRLNGKDAENEVCPRKYSIRKNKAWNCYNNLNSRLESRLDIKGKKAKEDKRNELYQELQNYLLDYPLYGFEMFKKKNSVLYTRKKRTPKKSKGLTK